MSDHYDLRTLTDGQCPADGCRYDGTDTSDAIRSCWNHAKNVKDDEHLALTDETSLGDWREAVAGDDQEDDVDDDQEGDADDEEETDDMVTKGEYDRQNGESGGEDDEDEDDDGTETTSSSTNGGANFTDVSMKWILFGLVAVVALFIVYRWASDSSSPTSAMADEPTDESEDSSTETTGPMLIEEG